MFNHEAISAHWANRLSFSIRKEIARRFKDSGFDITPKEWAILLLLWRDGSATPSAIADATFRDRTTVSRLVERMVRKGILERTVGREDRRKSILRLTELGDGLQEHLVPLARELVAQAQRGIPQEDLDVTVRTLRAMVENLSSNPET